MRDLMKYKIWYLVFSAVVIIPGIVALIMWGLNLSVDFKGGSVFRYEFESDINTADLEQVYIEKNIEVEAVVPESGNKYSIRTKPVDPQRNNEIKEAVSVVFPNSKQLSFETVGPSIGAETTRSAFIALGWAVVGIMAYIAFAFRNVPKPYSSFRFGASAVVAMLHDALLLVGLFALLGHFKNVEVDGFFITAVLTVLGFSVHDTIVVFDRIRENLGKLPKTMSFEDVANYSVVETLSRSVATSLTVIFTLSALYVLGGDTIKMFVLAMLVGIISGTYSSIFNATPILVLWENSAAKKKK
ncbi:protein-export membrane protein SecF [candidate division WWE3 bacterium RIFOXYB1_FULL_43_24]|uniref:Protein-export membrane protein SecF n=1 Tax=candidate division WWE3 bacterium GW2011_GWB1_42_6 TaxID=1619115 RepID=A0A0G1AVP4_UNCKA|nr:MAG: Protein translocase subunit SecF [candidate division WWE3 bacterium GW2011_GWA1_42_12]KKS39869.1 MAG: Protein translocase subunit SecF [candidate division WWE3 bacterium GW2011_GWE1_42_16]KKS65190.1 MAG: Protein translocase subunit SecF [candidate division WWE3 bacterium GW2011_GWB1_42_6]OGC69788.1 MAG: protein-export membrane protein SecF [candidate division WWE3 bacterium RIFOXYB1_FULL_43_24]OGC73746.1 MAG: protein-export membrane protein SecF [candidate division WWE3 bacterium RIFOXY